MADQWIIGRVVDLGDKKVVAPVGSDLDKHGAVVLQHQKRLNELIRAARAYGESPTDENVAALLVAAKSLGP
jgi:hypothetical protein